MKITEFHNGEAIDVLADLLDPAAAIFSDEKLREIAGKEKNLKVAQYILKEHKDSILEVLAIMNGETLETYTCNPVTIIKDVIELLSDKELVDFFFSQARELMQQQSSTAPMENIEAEGK